MAKKGTWEYECPQFVDFAAGLSNTSGGDDIYFDCDAPTFNHDEVFKNLRSPDSDSHPTVHHKEKKNLLTPDVNVRTKYLSEEVRTKYLSEEVENGLMNKMAAALSAIENTPRIAMIQKQQFENSTLKKPSWKIGGKSTNRNTMQKPVARIQRSKSVIALDRIVAKPNKENRLRKRSSSLNDLRTTKKQTYPMTPMCLKRTIIKAKNKIIKTTEEMELEEIARLQKQLKQHLRSNEISLKKLNLKPRQGNIQTNQRNIQLKPENLKEVGEKVQNPVLERSNFAQKDRRDLRELNHDALKKETLKIDAAINKHKSRLTEKFPKDNHCIKLKRTAAKSTEIEEKEVAKVVPKHLPQKKFGGFHSGLLFHDNLKKSTVVKPFSFDYKGRAPITGSENIAGVSAAAENLKLDTGKENVPVGNIRPLLNIKNVKPVQNQKVDTAKILESVKKIVDRRIANKNRGLSLCENIARN